MNCGKCLRFKSFNAENVWLGHCIFHNKNVSMPDLACENFVGEEVLDVFERFFIHRRDTYAIQQDDGTYRRVEGWLTKNVLRGHLVGETVGSYQINPRDNSVGWTCFDIDPEHVQDPKKTALEICQLARKAHSERSVWLEASRHPDPSYHVWILYYPRVPAKVAQFLGQRIVDQTDKSIELFPKQDTLQEGEFGNLVKLPLGLHRKAQKWSCFLDPETMNPLPSSCLLDVQPTSLLDKEIDRIMSLVERERPWFDREDLARRPYRGKTPACIQGLLKGVKKGWRNETGIRLASYFLNFEQLKESKTWKIMEKWNQRNTPPLEGRELRAILDSALRGEYVFGCDDELLQKFCVREGCKLAKQPSDEELIKLNLERLKATRLHPLIDYHPKVGFTLGVPLLGVSQKSLIITAEKAFIADFEAPLLEKQFPISISVRKVSGCYIQPNCGEEILNRASDLFSGNKIKFKAPSEVFQRVLSKGGEYWYHSDQRYLIAVTCWIIGSYLFPIFDLFPVLHPQGVRKSGKSTLLWVLWLLAWNPTSPEAALRGADLFRTIEGSRPTYLVDITRLPRRGPEANDIIDIFELGLERGGMVRRCDPDSLEPRWFEVYSPKAVASREELPFEDKCIRIITETAEDPEYTKRRAYLKFDPDARMIVSDLINCALHSWKDVLDAYHALEQTEKLKGRRFRLWSPLLAVCEVFSPNRYDELLTLAEEDAELQELGDRVSEVEDTVLSVLLAIEGKSAAMLLKELTEKVQDRISWVKDWHIVKSAIVNLGISKKRYQTNRGVAYQFDLELVRDRAGKRKIMLEETPKNVANRDVQHRLNESEEEEKTTSWDWDGFHVIGPYSPDVAYKKTLRSIRELQKKQTLTKEDVKQIVAYYWTKESYSRVWDQLLKDGVISPNVRERHRDSDDVVSRLRAEWTEDLTEEEILERLVQLGLTPAEAKHFFEDHLAGIELFWYDKEGKTVWRWA